MYTHLSCVNTAGALGWREWWRGDGGRVLFREKGYMFVELAAMWRMLRPAPLHIYANFSRGDETSANFLTLLPAIYFPLQTIRPAFKKSFQGCFFVAHPHPPHVSILPHALSPLLFSRNNSYHPTHCQVCSTPTLYCCSSRWSHDPHHGYSNELVNLVTAGGGWF